MLGGVSWEEADASLYPVPTCWVSRARSTELPSPGHHRGLGHCVCPPASPGAWDQCPSPWGCRDVPLLWAIPDSPREDAGLSPPLAEAWAHLTALQAGVWEGVPEPSSSGLAQPGELVPVSPKLPPRCWDMGLRSQEDQLPSQRLPSIPAASMLGLQRGIVPAVPTSGCLLASPPMGTCSTGEMKLICFPRVCWCQTSRFTDP